MIDIILINLLAVPVLLILCPIGSMSQGMDTTIREKAAGTQVVAATLRRLKNACLFTNDFFFMWRVAWVESHFGSDEGLFDPQEPKGIWQLSSRGFQDTLDTNAHPSLSGLCANISAQLGVNWPSMNFSNANMNKALYNALAARIYMQNNIDSIPLSVSEQAVFWYQKYTIKSNASADMFINGINSMPHCRSAGVDLIIVLDGSFSIGDGNFQNMKNVVFNIVNSTEIGPNRTQVAIFVFAKLVLRQVSFGDTNTHNKSLLLNIIANIDYPGGTTATADALAAARKEFDLARDLNLGFPRQLIILTDGESNLPNVTAIEAVKLRNLTWLESYAIGMGSAFTGSEANLQEISNIASLPTCTHVYTTPTVADISTLTDDLREASCQASAPICAQTNCLGAVTGQVSPGDARYFWDVAVRLVGRSYSLTTYSGTLRLYVSVSFENPGESVYDFKAVASPGTPALVNVSSQLLNVGYSGSDFRAPNGSVLIFLAVRTQNSSDGNLQSAKFLIKSAPGGTDQPTIASGGTYQSTASRCTNQTLATGRTYQPTGSGRTYRPGAAMMIANSPIILIVSIAIAILNIYN